MSRIKKLLMVVVALLLLAVGGLYLYKDAAVRSGVIASGDQVLGAESTTLDSASLDLFGGGLALRGLKLNNPEGYQQPHFGSECGSGQSGGHRCAAIPSYCRPCCRR